jgi:hypothetical protein
VTKQRCTHKSSLNKQDILKAKLGFKYKHGFRDTWYLRSEEVVPKVLSVLPVLGKYDETMMPDEVEVLKPLAHGRSVLRVRSSRNTGDSFIAKVFILRKLKHKILYNTLKHDQFAFAEAANSIIAAERGLNVPEVYGYGYIYEPYGLISKTITITEDLVDYVTVGELMKLDHGKEEACAEIMRRVIPIFAGLYNAACSNIDINLGSILFHRNDMKRESSVLDFEYAQFYDMPNPQVLMFNAVSFADRCQSLISEDTIIEWLNQLLDAVSIKDADARSKLIKVFDRYRNIKLRNKERRDICCHFSMADNCVSNGTER